MLRETEIRLTEITTSVVTPDLLAYIASSSGLKKLILKGVDSRGLDVSDHLADTFFQNALPRHTESLVELSCPSRYESRWTFGTHNADIISQMHNLEILEMGINATVVYRGFAQSSAITQSDVDLPVHLMLTTAASLSNLRSLAIRATDIESNRGVWSGPR
ncbi:hypothetical protein DFH07DRAFT_934590, partial [Mycena maculata]